MIVLNTGVPRSGTVLVNAILRRLLAAGDRRVMQANPHGAELPRLIRRLQETGQDRGGPVLVHTHSWDAETAALLRRSPRVAGFVNFRDPRDVAVSLMRLHDHDLATALGMTADAFRVFEAIRRDTSFMALPYEFLTADRPGHIFQIARRLGLWPGLDAVARIDAETSVERHRAVMEAVRAGRLETLARRRNRHRVLVEDRRTLINDRHIQSGRAGRWRTELDAAEAALATDRLRPVLERLGYPL